VENADALVIIGPLVKIKLRRSLKRPAGRPKRKLRRKSQEESVESAGGIKKSTPKTFSTAAAARKYYNAKLAEKRRKGYCFAGSNRRRRSRR